jgi:hypothetical protein
MYARFGDKAIRYIDPRLIAVLNVIRDYVGKPMTINNYKFGGNRTESGIRLGGGSHYRQFSAHSFGMAFDAVGDFDPDQLRLDIIEGRLVLPYPVRLEMGIGWLHVDVMNETEEPVIKFWP